MKRWKVYLCAAVFLLLTAVKMIAPAAAAISESDLPAPDAQLDESGAQPVYRVTLTTVYYFHPRYVVAVDQQTGTVLSVERSA